MVYLLLRHPSGRKSIKKFKTKKKGTVPVKTEYYSSAHHVNTEAMVKKVSKKKTPLKKMLRKKK